MAKTATAPTSKSAKASSTTEIKIRPLHDKVLIRRDEAMSRTDTGIFLPEKSKETPRTGVVEAVGTGRINNETGELIPLSVKPGDRVYIGPYAGDKVPQMGDDRLVIVEESEILAIVD